MNRAEELDIGSNINWSCERAQFGMVPKALVFEACEDLVGIAVSKAVPYLGRSYGVLERGDLIGQSYLMTLEQLERWNRWTCGFRPYLALTLHRRLRAYITGIKHHGASKRLTETAFPPSVIDGEIDEDGAENSLSLKPENVPQAQDEDPLDRLIVDDILDRLPKRHRQIFESRVFEEKLFSEIGTELGISGSTALGYYRRTVKWLRAYLDDPENTPFMTTAMLGENKKVSDRELEKMIRFMAEVSCTEKDAYSAGFPHRVWRMTNSLLRNAGYLKTVAVHGGGRRSYLTRPIEDCLRCVGMNGPGGEAPGPT